MPVEAETPPYAYIATARVELNAHMPLTSLSGMNVSFRPAVQAPLKQLDACRVNFINRL